MNNETKLLGGPFNGLNVPADSELLSEDGLSFAKKGIGGEHLYNRPSLDEPIMVYDRTICSLDTLCEAEELNLLILN